jgi:hypothetical protein
MKASISNLRNRIPQSLPLYMAVACLVMVSTLGGWTAYQANYYHQEANKYKLEAKLWQGLCVKLIERHESWEQKW